MPNQRQGVSPRRRTRALLFRKIRVIPQTRNRVRGCTTHPTKRRRPSEKAFWRFSDGLSMPNQRHGASPRRRTRALPFRKIRVIPQTRNRVRGCATHPTKRRRPSENVAVDAAHVARPRRHFTAQAKGRLKTFQTAFQMRGKQRGISDQRLANPCFCRYSSTNGRTGRARVLAICPAQSKSRPLRSR